MLPAQPFPCTRTRSNVSDSPLSPVIPLIRTVSAASVSAHARLMTCVAVLPASGPATAVCDVAVAGLVMAAVPGVPGLLVRLPEDAQAVAAALTATARRAACIKRGALCTGYS